MASDLRKIDAKELAKHTSEDDVWIVYKDKVYDVSKFYRTHPGGPDVIMEVAG